MRNPFALFFPLGALLGLVGVSHWLLYGRGLLASYNGQAHAMVQIQGFLLAFASGFLCTMLPRHFQAPTPSRLFIALLVICLVVGAGFGLASSWVVSHLAFLIAELLLVRFAARALGPALFRPPFLLLALGFLSAILGNGCLLLIGSGTLPIALYDWARALIQEGLFLGIALGLGAFLFPALMGDPQRPRASDGLMNLVALLIVVGFGMQGHWQGNGETLMATRIGQGLRALALLLYLFLGLRVQRRPKAPGNHRIWIWLAFLSMPIGPIAAALWPTHRVAMLHILFVGGFSVLAFSIGHHVMHAHSDRVQELLRKNRKVRVFGALFVFAMLTRVTSDLLPETYWIHIEGAAAAWLLAMVIWLWAVAKPLRFLWGAKDPVRNKLGE